MDEVGLHGSDLANALTRSTTVVFVVGGTVLVSNEQQSVLGGVLTLAAYIAGFVATRRRLRDIARGTPVEALLVPLVAMRTVLVLTFCVSASLRWPALAFAALTGACEPPLSDLPVGPPLRPRLVLRAVAVGAVLTIVLAIVVSTAWAVAIAGLVGAGGGLLLARAAIALQLRVVEAGGSVAHPHEAETRL